MLPSEYSKLRVAETTRLWRQLDVVDVDASACSSEVDGGSVLDVDAILLGRCLLLLQLCDVEGGDVIDVDASACSSDVDGGSVPDVDAILLGRCLLLLQL